MIEELQSEIKVSRNHLNKKRDQYDRAYDKSMVAPTGLEPVTLGL